MSQQINLFNPVFLKRETHLSASTMAVGIGLVLLVCVAAGGFVGYGTFQLSQTAGTTDSLVKSAEAQVQKLAGSGKQEKSPTLQADLQKAEAELTSLKQVSDVLNRGEMGNTQGYAEYLRAFARQSISGVWLTGFMIQGAGNEISLEGRALQPSLVPAYVGRLKSEPILRGKAFGSLDIRVPDGPPAKAGAPAGPAPYIAFVLQSENTEPGAGK